MRSDPTFWNLDILTRSGRAPLRCTSSLPGLEVTDDLLVELELVSVAGGTGSSGDDSAPIGAGAVFDWMLDIRNDGPSTAVDVIVTDTIPTRAKVIGITSADFDGDFYGQDVTCTVTTPASGATARCLVRERGRVLAWAMAHHPGGGGPGHVSATVAPAQLCSRIGDLRLPHAGLYLSEVANLASRARCEK